MSVVAFTAGDVDRLVLSAVEQGHPRYVEDADTLDQIAATIRRVDRRQRTEQVAS